MCLARHATDVRWDIADRSAIFTRSEIEVFPVPSRDNPGGTDETLSRSHLCMNCIIAIEHTAPAKAAPSRGGECTPDPIHEGPLPQGGEGIRVSASERWGSLTHKAAGLFGQREETPLQPPAPFSRGERKCSPHQFSSSDRLAIRQPGSIKPHATRGQGRVRDRIKGLAVARFSSDGACGGRSSGRSPRPFLSSIYQPCRKRGQSAIRFNSRPWISATSRGARNPRTLITGSGGRLAVSGRAVA